MKKLLNLFGIVVFLAVIGFIFAACPEPETDSELPTLTGMVTISGTARVGQTLTADTSALGGSGTIDYQWMRDGVNIGTNSSTYTIQAEDTRATITVTVTRSGNSGSVISPPIDVELSDLTGSMFYVNQTNPERGIYNAQPGDVIAATYIPSVDEVHTAVFFQWNFMGEPILDIGAFGAGIPSLGGDGGFRHLFTIPPDTYGIIDVTVSAEGYSDAMFLDFVYSGWPML